MTTPAFPDRLRNARFAQRHTRRVVDHSPLWKDHTNCVTPGSDLEAELLDVIARLGNGDLLPESCYRNRIDQTPDRLLEDYGIKHLHLGGSGSDVILFLVEYRDSVLLLEINTHFAFQQCPVGSALRAIHATAITDADQRSMEAREARATAIRSGLKRRPE